MSEIKTTCRGTPRLIEAATMTHEEYLNLHTQGVKELRAAYEALQKENAELKRIQSTDAIDFWNLTEQNAAQTKRIDELYDVANAHRYSYIAAAKVIETQKSEIESLRKQVEELLGASRMAITALAHTSQKNELYDEAYERLDSAISFVSASKNGE